MQSGWQSVPSTSPRSRGLCKRWPERSPNGPTDRQPRQSLLGTFLKAAAPSFMAACKERFALPPESDFDAHRPRTACSPGATACGPISPRSSGE
ncbi:hypothetical protein C9419_16700 [Paraburkholderia fungorum]|nr:hypothetical protein C9419_16700 [Paraburkholderia fungorum]